MKFTIALALLTVTAVATGTKDIDWSQVKPLQNIPRVPTIPRSHNVASERITNGELAAEKQFPYQVGLLLYLNGGQAFCGGQLISDRWVLTAAHCTDSLKEGVDVILGAWNRQDKTEKNQQIIFVPAHYVIVHEDYDPEVIENDISLIKLPVAVEFNDYIQPVMLPTMSSSNQYATYAGDEAIASGWGKISDQENGATDKLRWIKAPIMTNSGCSTWYLGQVHSTNICIKTTGGYSTCNGDSGGPLVLANEPHTLIGLTSFGIGLGCERGWPGVFTRITSFLPWIKQNSGVYYE